jgi:hypothetical protein
VLRPRRRRAKSRGASGFSARMRWQGAQRSVHATISRSQRVFRDMARETRAHAAATGQAACLRGAVGIHRRVAGQQQAGAAVDAAVRARAEDQLVLRQPHLRRGGRARRQRVRQRRAGAPEATRPGRPPAPGCHAQHPPARAAGAARAAPKTPARARRRRRHTKRCQAARRPVRTKSGAVRFCIWRTPRRRAAPRTPSPARPRRPDCFTLARRRHASALLRSPSGAPAFPADWRFSQAFVCSAAERE